MFKRVSKILGIIGTSLALVLAIVLYIQSVEMNLALPVMVPLLLLTIVVIVLTFVATLLMEKIKALPGISMIVTSVLFLADVVIFSLTRGGMSVLTALPFEIVPLILIALAALLYYVKRVDE